MVFGFLVHKLRGYAATFFYKFGLHCAKNQIRVIIISDLVITSLFYPALAIYFSSQPLSHFSTRLHDSLFALNSHAALYRTDLREIWETLDGVQIREDSAAQARCGAERTIRIERVLVPSVIPNHPFGSLNKETLVGSLALQRRIQSSLKSSNLLEYVPDSDSNEPLVLGPLKWDIDDATQLSDSNLVVTVNSRKNISVAGIPLSNDVTLAGRGPVDDQGWIYEAEFVVLTYFFVESDCHANTKHTTWSNILQNAVSGHGTITQPTAQPKLIALEYSAEQPTARVSFLSITLYICYIVIFVYFSGALRRIDTVHSRFGLAFTGIVEIIASTITSVSVCALWGFRVTMVPWPILPVMIVFIGAEDMFILIQEVVSTSITLPVKERIAQGLSRAGTSNTFKVFAYNAIFGSMAYFATGAIKQFCIFTVVVLVAHWFLIHTFFVAVLAIDIQRLELADLLHQGPRIEPSVHSISKDKAKEGASSETKTRWRYFRKDRAAKNGSLLVILAITAVLWQASQPNPRKEVRVKPDPDAARSSFIQAFSAAEPTASIPDGVLIPEPYDDPTLRATTEKHAAAAKFWHVFNPDNTNLLHLRIESPALVTLQPSAQSVDDKSHQLGEKRRALWRTLRPLMWTARVVVVPIGATVIALYILLLYLLKDAELLEAQRNRAEGDSPAAEEHELKRLAGQPLDGDATFLPLSRSLIADVDLITTSQDGRVVAAVTTENEFSYWTVDEGVPMLESDRKLLLLAALLPETQDSKVTAIALNEDGTRCAIGLANGAVIQWSLRDGLRNRTTTRSTTPSPVFEIAFLPTQDYSMASSASTIKAFDTLPSLPPLTLLATFRDGSAWTWEPLTHRPPIALPISGPASQHNPSYLVDEDGCMRVALALQAGGLCLMCRTVGSDGDLPDWHSTVIEVDEQDVISCFKLAGLHVGSQYMVLLAVSTSTGRITVYDCSNGQTLCSLHDSNYDNISRLRIAPIQWQHCKHCGKKEPEGFLLAFSVGSVVEVYRAVSVLKPHRCSCPMTSLQRSSNGLLRDKFLSQQQSRSSSFSASSSPRAHRSALPPMLKFPALDYPIPGHGFHSRRTSEKEPKSRHSIETATSDSTDYDGVDFLRVDGFLPDQATRARSSSNNTRASDIRLINVGEVPCERGVWDIIGQCVVGIRRRPRTRNASTSTDSPFARWEIWSFNPPLSTFRSSPLPSLLQPPQPTTIPPPSQSHRPQSLLENPLIQRQPNLRRFVQLATPISSAAQGSSQRTTSGRKEYPVLPFTRVSTLRVCGTRIGVGLGNTVGIVEFDEGLDAQAVSSSNNTTSSSSSFFSSFFGNSLQNGNTKKRV
ncbi:hypothetical protein FRB99_003412 [Tulasnella sp. 403]|nr:hypothetical protein FRB99_003412 [Tulasnella sp. 403]